jgi:hypothetical protein
MKNPLPHEARVPSHVTNRLTKEFPMLTSARPSSVRVRFRPRLEALEDRALLAVTASFAGSVLTFTGTNAADAVALDDDGAGTIAFTATGAGSSSFRGVKQIVLNLKGGNDTVAYNLSGNLITARTINADLGAGNDSFVANFAGRDLLGDMNLSVKGGAGNDHVEMNLIGFVASGTTLNATVNGNDGKDQVLASMAGAVRGRAEFDVGGNRGADAFTLNAMADVDVATGGVLDVASRSTMLNLDYRGELDGKLLLDAAGDNGKDALSANLVLDAGSTGSVGSSDHPATIDGKRGNDVLGFTVVNNSSSAKVNATLSGGGGTDTGTHTSNVTTSSIETDQAV